MNKYDELIIIIRNELMKKEVVNEYFKLKKIIGESKYIQNLDNEIKYYQKCKMNDEEKNKYLELLDTYNNDPLIVQYKNVREEVEIILSEIKDILK